MVYQKQFDTNKEYTKTINKAITIYYSAPEIIVKGIYNKKSDMYSLGCIMYELFNLRKYYDDSLMKEIKKIDSNIYNYKWQEIIDSLLQANFNDRMNINEIYNKILNLILKIMTRFLGTIYSILVIIKLKLLILNL